MINRLIELSVKNKFIVLVLTVGLLIWGLYAIKKIPLDAVPDVTNNQVQIITTSRNLSTQDVEQFITYPVELEMANLPGVTEIRSVSKFGLSVVTVVFEDNIGTFVPRQLIAEKLISAQSNIPEGFGTPAMGPITTGLGEIYQYTLEIEPEYRDKYSLTDLRTIQDWIVKRQLSGIPGVVEVNTWGGKLKQYVVSVDPILLNEKGISLTEVFTALDQNNHTTGGGYIEKNDKAYFIRGEGLVQTLSDIENIVIRKVNGIPVYIRDIGNVEFGYANRFGAITGNGEGEKVMGQVMLLKDANTGEVIEAVKSRVAEIEKSLPEGIYINPFLERTELIDKTIFTVVENLVLGALIVILVVILLLGNIRAGLLIASIIPLALLFAISLMNTFGISANLMSLGAIDFGIIIDGAIIIVEYVLLTLSRKLGELNEESQHNQAAKDEITVFGSVKMMRSAIFGQLIILIVFIPILSLSGVEGKMFAPMALTFCFALLGAMILCLTYVPALASIFLKPVKKENRISKGLIEFLYKMYEPVLRLALKFKLVVLTFSLVFLGGAFMLFNTMGGEFVPTLDEGDLVIQPRIPTGTSLSETIEICTKIENVLLSKFPEVEQVVSRIGAAEVPTDPMSMEEPDVIVKLKPKSEWVRTASKDDLIELMKEELSIIPGVEYEFTQPIEMRFNELITGVRADVAIKIYGENLDTLAAKGDEVKQLIQNVEGAGDVNVEKTDGLPQMLVKYDRVRLAQYGLNVQELNSLIEIAFGGKSVGSVFEDEMRFDLVVRFNNENRQNIEDISSMMIPLDDGTLLPINEVAEVSYTKGPAMISRDGTKRRIVIGVNVRDRDMQSVVEDIQMILDDKLDLPPGYSIDYGGQFENLNNAKERLTIVVPISLVLIFLLLYLTFKSISEALLVFAAIPLAATGGVVLLWIRDLPFSISAGVGFIALFGIAVLNGIVLLEHYREMKEVNQSNLFEKIIIATKQRMRPVLITAAAAALGFFPMAISGSSGAEVQRPLATVVIGGLISATILTLVVLPVLYSFLKSRRMKNLNISANMIALLIISAMVMNGQAFSQNMLSMEEAVNLANQNNPRLKAAVAMTLQSKYEFIAGLDAEKLSVGYGFGQINSNVGDYQWSISQQFYFPTVYVSRLRLMTEKTALAKAYENLQANELSYEVRSSYCFLVYLMHEQKLMQKMVNEFEHYVEFATIKLEAGEGTLLEKTSAVVKLESLNLRLNQIRQQRDLYFENLILLMNAEQHYVISDTLFEKQTLNLLDSTALQSNPELIWFAREIDLAEQEIKLARSAYLPEINLGYMNQQIDGIPGLSSFYVGISIPLFVNEKSAEVQRSKLNKEILAYQYEEKEIQLKALFNQLLAEYKTGIQKLDFYQTNGLLLAEQLENSSRTGYFEGQIDYVEYISGIEQAYSIQQDFLSSLSNYNQVVLKLNYLTGK